MCLLSNCSITIKTEKSLRVEGHRKVKPEPEADSISAVQTRPGGFICRRQSKTQIMKIQTQFNYVRPEGTKARGDSLTVPGEAYTIPQLMERARGGIPLNTLVEIKEDHFASDADFETFVPEADYDMVDAMEQYKQSSAIIDDAKKRLSKAEKEKVSPTLESDEGANNGPGIPDPDSTKKVAKSGSKTAQPDD